MKILLLTPIHREFETKNDRKTMGIPYYQGQASWVRSLVALGHTVNTLIYTNSFISSSYIRIRLDYCARKYFPLLNIRLQRKFRLLPVNLSTLVRTKVFVNKCEKVKPDVVMISGGISGIDVRSICKLKERLNFKIFLMEGVNPEFAATFEEKKMIRMGVVDIVVENDSGYASKWKKLGAKKVIVLPISSVDPIIHLKSNKKIYDVTFVGSLLPDRVELLTKIVQKTPINIWGDIKPGVRLPQGLKKYYKGQAFGKKMIDIVSKSKIVLNFQPADMIIGGNMRTFEIVGCKVLQLTDKVSADWFQNGTDVIVFKNIDDLVKKIKYYLKHVSERNIIAENGYKKGLMVHTYEKHFKKLLS